MLKTIHLATVAITLILFVTRGTLIYLLRSEVESKLLKIAPHVNDTVLLVTGIWLAIDLQQYPFVDHWLTAKVIALLAYIILGMVAMKWGRGQSKGFIAWLIAILVIAYMITVAVYKSPLSVFA